MRQYIVLLLGILMMASWQTGWAQDPPTPTPVIPINPDPIAPEVREQLNKVQQNGTTTNPTDNSNTKTTNTKTDNNTEPQEEGDVEGSENEEDEKKIKFDLRQAELPEAKIWGQQFFRDQSISLFTRSRDIKAIDSYLLGIGDELAITVWGATDYSASVAIEEDGFISLSNPSRGLHIPRLYLRDMKFSDARKAIVERLKNHMDMDYSQISIELNYSRSLTVNITGEVFNPGAYTIPAVNTAFNALVASGGPSQIGSVRKIRVVSNRKEDRILDIYQFMNNPEVADEFFLTNNDYIHVPLAGRVVEIEGAIERPFFYELIEGENLMELIEHAGGLRPDAYRRNIQIIRYDNDEETLIDVNLAELKQREINFTLKDGDRISINPIKQAFANYITVKGAVKLPGTYQLTPETTVYDVLMKAGIIRSAVMKRIYLKRLEEDLSLNYIPINVHDILDNPSSPENLKLNPFDEIEVKSKSEFIDEYSVKVYGAVRQPGTFAYSNKLKLTDVLYMANGITRAASNSRLEVSRLILDEDGNETYIKFQTFEIGNEQDSFKVKGADMFQLQPADQIFVRKSKRFRSPGNIQLKGEILWPGYYTLASDEERVLDVLLRAGDCTNIAFLEGAKLMRKGEGLVLLDLEELKRDGAKSRYNYVLMPDDVIIIPKLKDLVSIAGRVNHPAIKESSEIAAKELDLEIERADTDLEKKEIILEAYKKEIADPKRVNVPFHTGKRAIFYIREYGAGIDRKQGGRQRLVYVRYANGMVRKTHNFLFFKVYPKVEKGAMVYVGMKEKKIRKERKPVDWYKVITDTFALAVSGLSVYALINALRQPKTK